MHQLQEEGLAPIAVADPTTLIRRATFDPDRLAADTIRNQTVP